jgi:alpha-L-fucosidase
VSESGRIEEAFGRYNQVIRANRVDFATFYFDWPCHQLEDLVRTIRTLGPDCIINSRIKTFRLPLPQPFLFCDYISLGDNEIADRMPGYDWENPGTLNSTYEYSRNDNNWIDPREIVFRLVDIVSKGGNYLLNVGPTSGAPRKPRVDICRSLEYHTGAERVRPRRP